MACGLTIGEGVCVCAFVWLGSWNAGVIGVGLVFVRLVAWGGCMACAPVWHGELCWHGIRQIVVQKHVATSHTFTSSGSDNTCLSSSLLLFYNTQRGVLVPSIHARVLPACGGWVQTRNLCTDTGCSTGSHWQLAVVRGANHPASRIHDAVGVGSSTSRS